MTSTQTTDEIIEWFPSKTQKEMFCTLNLTKSIDQDFNLTLTSSITDSDNDIVILQKVDNTKITTIPIDQDLVGELPYLTHWSRITDEKDKKLFSIDNQWPVRYPRSFWNFPKLDDTINFSCW